jgi:hypothetical protein
MALLAGFLISSVEFIADWFDVHARYCCLDGWSTALELPYSSLLVSEADPGFG